MEEAKANKKEGFLPVFEDVVMLFLVVLNLAFVSFDWCFKFEFFQDFVQTVSYDFFIFYRDEIHPNFLLYDLIFVFIFITELVLQWFIAAIRKTYDKWWIYPFAHWYDVLGCIPVGVFKWFRLFRIATLIIRLHKLRVIDLRKTILYKKFYHGYSILLEEITDKTFIKIIEALQREIKTDNEKGVIADAVKPNQNDLAKIISGTLQKVASDNYRDNQPEVNKQIEDAIKQGFENSKAIKRIAHLPVFGSQLTKNLEKSLSDISVQVVDRLVNKLASDEMTKTVEDVINTTLNTLMEENKELKMKTGTEKELSIIVKDIADRILEKLKENIDRDLKTKVVIPEPIGNLSLVKK